jgi:predicted N-acetyltransferase YhbS
MQSIQVSSERATLLANQPVNAMGFNLRPGRPEDAPPCGKICYEAFTTISESHNFPPDFPSIEAATGLVAAILQNPGVYSVVAESAGRILGSNFLWEDTIAGVGPITVDPAVQNGAVGRRLMQDVLDYSHRKGFAGVRLVQAAYHNRSLALYAKLGFVIREPLATLQDPAINEQTPVTMFARPTTETWRRATPFATRSTGTHVRPN